MTVTFSNDKYNSATADSSFNADKIGVILTVEPVKGIVGEDITLVAHVTDENGNEVSGGNLVFKINGRTLREDGRFDTDEANPMKFHVKDGIVTYTMNAYKQLTGAENIKAVYSGSYRYESCRSEIANASVILRTAQVSVDVTPSVAKQNTDIVFTAKLTDITENATNATCITTNASVLFKINGVSMKDENGNPNWVPATSTVVNYVYHVPAGMAGVYVDGSTRNYTVEAVYNNTLFYRDVRNTTDFNVERSIVNVNFESTTVKNNVLSVKAKFTDYEGNNLVGTNKICIKINGITYKEDGQTKYFYVDDGDIDISGIKLDEGTVVKSVTIVTGDRCAYLSARTTTTDISTS